MTLRLWIQPEAESDIENTFRWYEEQRVGLGHEFLLALEASLQHVRRYPYSKPKIHHELRRTLLRRFPYGVFYLLAERALVVVACFHCRRDPRWMLAQRA